MKIIEIKLTNELARLTVYLPDKSPEMPYMDIRPGVLVIPGGGYGFVCIDHEGDAICRYLNDNGILSSCKKPMTKTTVAAILQNRKYIGEYRYRDVLIPDGIPSIISKELFAMAQDRVAKNRYAPATYKADDKYLLTTKLMCGDCGKYLVGESGTGRRGKKYYYYKCTTAKKKEGCNRKPFKKEKIEDIVISQILRSIFHSHSLEAIVDHVMMWQEKERTALPLLQRELAEVEKSLGNVMSAIEQGIILYHKKKNVRA